MQSLSLVKICICIALFNRKLIKEVSQGLNTVILNGKMIQMCQFYHILGKMFHEENVKLI